MATPYLSNYNSVTRNYNLNPRLVKANFWLIVAIALWFIPASREMILKLDVIIFKSLNSSLLAANWWATLWGYLNHGYENWLNAIVMVSINIWIILATPRKNRSKLFWQVVYYWLMFQFGVILLRLFFIELMDIHRNSPTVDLENSILISKLLNNHQLKDLSNQSFPAGHAFVAVYWASFSFTLLVKNRCMIAKACILCIALLMCSARIFSGAHWPSDIFFTVPMAWAWFCWAKAFLNNWKISNLDSI